MTCRLRRYRLKECEKRPTQVHCQPVFVFRMSSPYPTREKQFLHSHICRCRNDSNALFLCIASLLWETIIATPLSWSIVNHTARNRELVYNHNFTLFNWVPVFYAVIILYLNLKRRHYVKRSWRRSSLPQPLCYWISCGKKGITAKPPFSRQDTTSRGDLFKHHVKLIFLYLWATSLTTSTTGCEPETGNAFRNKVFTKPHFTVFGCKLDAADNSGLHNFFS